VILHRCFAWERRAAPDEPGGAIWFARPYQGDGRHDNPERYACLYAAEAAVSAIVEQLARFRGNVLVPGMLRRRGLPLALATLELDDRARLVDLDNPGALAARGLRPSLVATRRRERTQPQALSIHAEGADGLRWWSTFESLWMNLTLFDRAAARVRVSDVRVLGRDHPALGEALELLGIAPGR
jgi:RES domain-containing protein